MSEAAFNPADLLSTLTANPQMLKDAMQMASALASSGMLNGLFSKENPSESRETGGKPNDSAKESGDFATLLSGILSGQSESFAHDRRDSNPQAAHRAEYSQSASADRGGAIERTRKPPPCHNDRIQLLRSLRPFLPEEKRDKIDFLIQLLGLLNAAGQMGLGKLF